MQNIYGLKVKDGLDIYETNYNYGGDFELMPSWTDYAQTELSEKLLTNQVNQNSLIFVKVGVKSEEKDGVVVNTPLYQRAIILKVNDTQSGTRFEFGYLGENGLPILYNPEIAEEEPKDFKIYTPALTTPK